jgi:hypothetical protein
VSLGDQYRFIVDTCYYFDKIAKDVDDTQRNCGIVFGPNRHGKLMEPTSMAVVQKLYAMAKEFIQDNKDVLTGFEKVDNAGSMKHSSNDVMAQIQPWLNTGSDVDDSGQPYMRFYPNRDPVEWHDGVNEHSGFHNYAICESF